MNSDTTAYNFFPISSIKKESLPIQLAFLISIIYWLYLAFISEPILIHDSVGYQWLGQLILEKGWKEYFITGPNREPLYPLLLSLSIGLSKIFSIPYYPILKCFQITLLFLTQILAFQLFKKLKISSLLTAAIIFYLGISPSLVNSTLRVYSEIITYPLTVLVILQSGRVIRSVLENNKAPSIIRPSFLLAFFFVLLTLTKAVFEMITPVYFFLLSFFIFYNLKKHKKPLKPIFLLACVLLFSFYLPITIYKSLNKAYNGDFALTNRGAWALYGNTARRMQPEAIHSIPTALTYLPGQWFCESLLGYERCRFWSFEISDNLGASKRQELERIYPKEKIDKAFLQSSFKEIQKNSFQYFIFFILEGMKMFFWEQTQDGQVVYPDWLDNLYRFAPLRYGLTLLMAFLTLVSLLTIKIIIFKPHGYFKDLSTLNDSQILLLNIIAFISLFIFFHSFFFILPRYSFPLVPLFLALIAFFFQKLLFKA